MSGLSGVRRHRAAMIMLALAMGTMISLSRETMMTDDFAVGPRNKVDSRNCELQ